MRDDTHRWDVPFSKGDVLRVDGVEISSLTFLRLSLISGTRARAQSSVPVIGWPDIAPKEGAYALSLRRDRVLEVNGPVRADGWDEENARAVSDMSDGYHGFKLMGAGAMALLKRGGEISLDLPSASVARVMFGLPSILYRLSPDSFALVFNSAQASAGWAALAAQLRPIA